MLKVKEFVFNLFKEKAMTVGSQESRCVVIDPGCYYPEEEESLLSHLRDSGLTPEAVLLTHAHLDHIFGVRKLLDIYDIPVYMNPADKVILEYNKELAKRFGIDIPDSSFSTVDISDGDILELAGLRFEVITTPGHTPGSVCYYERDGKALFTGDTLFAGTIGRTDLEYGSYDDIIVSVMDKLMGLDGDVEIFPGHGTDSSISYERTHNPFLEPWGEKEDTDSWPATNS